MPAGEGPKGCWPWGRPVRAGCRAVTAAAAGADSACVREPRWARRCGPEGGTESRRRLQGAAAWIGPSASRSSASGILREGLAGNMVPRAKAFQRLVLILGHSCGNAGVVVGPASTPLGSPDFLLEGVTWRGHPESRLLSRGFSTLWKSPRSPWASARVTEQAPLSSQHL